MNIRMLSAVLLVFAGLSSQVFCADLDIGTHANFYLPPEGGGNTLMTGVDATYRLDDHFSARGSVDNSNYAANGIAYSVTSLSLTLIEHLLGASVFDPYLGAGMTISQKKVDAVENNMTGYNAVAGVALNSSSVNVGVEIKYTIPDSGHMETGYYSVGGNLTSAVHISL
jgi:hypothetical protein